MIHHTILLLTMIKPILLEGKNPIRVIDIFTNYPNTEEVLKEYSIIQKQRLDSENSAALNITSRSFGDYDYYDKYDKYRPQDYRRPYYSDRRNYHDPGDILESEFGVFDDHKYNNYADRYQDKYVYLQGQKYSDYTPDYYNHYTISKPQNPDDNPENFKDKLNKFIAEVEQRPGFYTKKNNTQIYTIMKPTYYADQFHFENEVASKPPEIPDSSIEVVGDIQSEYGDIVTTTTTTTTTTEAPKKKPAKIIKKRPKPVNLINEPNVNTTRMKLTNILRKYLVKMHQTKGERKLVYDRAYPPVVQTVSGNVVPNLIANTTFGLDEAKQKFITYPLESIKNKTVNFANKFLSLFTVIQFSNFKCQATSASSAYEGTCYLANECTSLGGVAMGNCAAGYGVCCVFRGTCGGIGMNNCTYFESPGYPNYFPSDPGVVTPMPETTTVSGLPTPDPRFQYMLRQGRHVRQAVREGRREARQATTTTAATDQMNALSCIYRVYKSNPNIKQMRIDFIDLELRGPTDGNCVNERLVITGMGLSTMVPVLCGYNTGQHLYVDVSMMTGPLQLAVLATAIERKRYKIRICQYSDGCSGNMNCLQYYTGVTGTITSFNYDQAATFNRSTPSYLNNLNYAICIRREPGYCTVTYTTTGPMNVQYPFQIRNTDAAGMLTVPANQAGVGVINCPDDYIVINGIRLCGDRLNDGSMIADFTRNAPVTDTSGGPIIIPVKTSARTVGRGFKLFYTQNRCPMNTMTGMVLPVPDPRGRQDDYYEELEER